MLHIFINFVQLPLMYFPDQCSAALLFFSHTLVCTDKSYTPQGLSTGVFLGGKDHLLVNRIVVYSLINKDVLMCHAWGGCSFHLWNANVTGKGSYMVGMQNKHIKWPSGTQHFWPAAATSTMPPCCFPPLGSWARGHSAAIRKGSSKKEPWSRLLWTAACSAGGDERWQTSILF